MRNYFILNGVDSRDFGVYISGQGTFDAPQKSYSFYNVPGRDGALLSSDNRLENATLTYEAFIYKDFNVNVANFRTFLLSLNGYTKLTDSYHPDEFRYAVYTGPFEPKVQSKNDAGSFKITFSCKPQRYLLSGEAETYIGGSHTISGNVISVDALLIDDSSVYLRLNAGPESGTPDAPTYFDGYTSVGFSVNGSTAYSSPLTVTDSGTPVPLSQSRTLLEGEVDLLTGTGGEARLFADVLPNDGWSYSNGFFTYQAPAEYTGTIPDACTHFTPSTSGADKTIQFDNGLIKIKYNKFTTVPSLAEVRFNAWMRQNVVKVAVGLEYDLSVTAYTPNFPTSGQVLIETDGEYQELVIGYFPTGSFSNSTYMKARPLITASVNSSTGGSFTINNDTVTIATGVSEVVIDCEMQDCYFGSTNLNNKVSFAPTYDFPVLNPGENVITQGTGISSLIIKPRWWRL